MTYEAYTQLFQDILSSENPAAPYDDPHYLEYAKLNYSRSNRWMKHGEILEKAKEHVQHIFVDQTWVLITEPWCGDAAHIVPFIVKLAELSHHVTLEIQLRDSGSEIDSYLTNGGKSIPKLIIRNEHGSDVAVWGPRPKACQELFNQLKEENADFETQKIALQNWYNTDKGVAIQEELAKVIDNATEPF